MGEGREDPFDCVVKGGDRQGPSTAPLSARHESCVFRQTGKASLPGHRLGHLETLRGLAALIVFAGHTVIAFNQPAFRQWVGSPLLVFVNGGAAVSFFFVLSGYVLTIGALRTA